MTLAITSILWKTAIRSQGSMISEYANTGLCECLLQLCNVTFLLWKPSLSEIHSHPSSVSRKHCQGYVTPTSGSVFCIPSLVRVAVALMGALEDSRRAGLLSHVCGWWRLMDSQVSPQPWGSRDFTGLPSLPSLLSAPFSLLPYHLMMDRS